SVCIRQCTEAAAVADEKPLFSGRQPDATRDNVGARSGLSGIETLYEIVGSDVVMVQAEDAVCVVAPPRVSTGLAVHELSPSHVWLGRIESEACRPKLGCQRRVQRICNAFHGRLEQDSVAVFGGDKFTRRAGVARNEGDASLEALVDCVREGLAERRHDGERPFPTQKVEGIGLVEA